jgi:hypothetical protein
MSFPIKFYTSSLMWPFFNCMGNAVKYFEMLKRIFMIIVYLFVKAVNSYTAPNVSMNSLYCSV